MEIFRWADVSSVHSNIFKRISSFSNHPSIQIIKDKYQNSFNFKFELVRTDQIAKFIDEIDCNKSSSGDIPAKIIKIKEETAKEKIRANNKLYKYSGKSNNGHLCTTATS